MKTFTLSDSVEVRSIWSTINT